MTEHTPVEINDEDIEWLKSKKREEKANKQSFVMLNLLEQINNAYNSIPEEVQIPEQLNDSELWRQIRCVILRAGGKI